MVKGGKKGGENENELVISCANEDLVIVIVPYERAEAMHFQV